MKLDDLNDLKDLDTKFNDPFEILFDDEDKKKKKKKKDKKKDKDKSGDKRDREVSYKESLKELSKKELKKKAQNMGIDLDMVDCDSKKVLRKAILKARDDTKRGRELKAVKTDEPKKSSIVNDPPFYFDEDNRDFVVRNADTAPDMVCFDAMRSLGKIRRGIRPDDGFGELMDRITKKLIESDPKDKGPVIDVDFTEVDDDDDKPGTIQGLAQQEALPTPKEKDSVELTSEEVEKFSKDVDVALEQLKTAKAKDTEQRRDHKKKKK